MTSIAVENDAHWHALRKQHVGTSESPALLGCHPRLTQWQLFHIKKGLLDPPDLSDNEMVQGGRFIEPALAAWAEDKFDIKLRKVRRYIVSDMVPMMGGSLDYEEFGTGTLIPTELKFSMFGQEWEYDGDVLTDYPLAYGVQVQHQLALTGAPHGNLIAFCGGALRRAIVPRREGIIGAIEEAIRAFAASIEANVPPDPDWEADADAVMKLHGRLGLANLNLTGDEKIAGLCRAYLECRAAETRAAELKDAARAELITRISDAAAQVGRAALEVKTVAVCEPFKVSAAWVDPTVRTLTEEAWQAMKADIGVPKETRKGYRRITISERKDKDSGKNPA